jgi:hypothetical protein
MANFQTFTTSASQFDADANNLPILFYLLKYY